MPLRTAPSLSFLRVSFFSSSRSFSSRTRRESTMLPRFLLNLMTLNLNFLPMKLVEVADGAQVDLASRAGTP